MCVPESALRYYELELEQAFEADEAGFDSWDEYQDFLADKAMNDAYDEWKDKQE